MAEVVDEWLSARQAVALVAKAYDRPVDAREAIINRAAAGLIAVRCHAVRHSLDTFAGGAPEAGCRINARFWQTMMNQTGRMHEDWQAGDFIVMDTVMRGGEHTAHYTHVFGAEFRGDDLLTIPGVTRSIGASQAFGEPDYRLKGDPSSDGRPAPITDHLGPNNAQSSKPSNQKRRGPKPKSFWGDAMAAVEASISAGELLASSLADVERAMADWIAENGYDAGESTIRNYAKPVWERRSRRGQ